MIRDIVEIVAILAAGIWAFYVFIYENRILPSQAQPEVNFTASLAKVSQHNGLVGVRMDTDIHNIGTVRAHFLGVATAVVGQRILPTVSARPAIVTTDAVSRAPFYTASKNAIVYENAYVTALGDPRTGQDLPLEPGNDVRSETIFYVPERRFDRLSVYVVGRFTRDDDKPIPTRLYEGKDGLPRFTRGGSNVSEFSTYVTSLDLNGP